MDTIEALQYQYNLNQYIKKCLKLNISYSEIWEALTTDEEQYKGLSEFLQTRIGPIWLKRELGQKFTAWQQGSQGDDSNG